MFFRFEMYHSKRNVTRVLNTLNICSGKPITGLNIGEMRLCEAYIMFFFHNMIMIINVIIK